MKLFMWTLIEVNTVLFIAIAVTLYLLYKQKKNKKNDKQSNPEESKTLESTANDTQTANLDQLIAQQLHHAALRLTDAKNNNDDKKITLIKLWGTLLKAERSVLKDHEEIKTEKTLKHFLDPILQAIFDSKNSDNTLVDLEKKLEQIIQETSESHSTLEVKEKLERVQNSLRKTLVNEISHLEIDATKLKIKRNEKIKLEASLVKANKNLEKLKQKIQSLDTNEFESDLFDEAISSSSQRTPPSKHGAVKQIEKLTKLSDRQQNIIDLLKDKIDSTAPDTEEDNEASNIAITRLERLLQESDSLIIQLEAELKNAEHENDELKSNIASKSLELKEITKKLSSSKKTVLGSLKENTQNNQAAVNDLKSTLGHDQSTPEMVGLITQQTEELSTIERLLQESETCVTLLEQELETSRNNNIDLLDTIEQAEAQLAVPEQVENDETMDVIQKKHQSLISEHEQIKKQLVSLVSSDDKEVELRSAFNKKNLELDRLQLSFIDLEQKHIKLLSKNDESN